MMGPALAGSPRVTGHRDYVIKTLLHGMTGPLAGRTYTQVMLPMGSQTDQWIANVGSYIRNEFGNTASFIAPAEVASVRAATAARKAMWTYPELEVTLPRLLPVDPTWKAMASHNTERAPSGLTLAAWTTATPQAPDMWYQVELPQAAMVTEVQFDAGAPGGGGRGRGGRGAVPAGAAGAAGWTRRSPGTGRCCSGWSACDRASWFRRSSWGACDCASCWQRRSGGRSARCRARRRPRRRARIRQLSDRLQSAAVDGWEDLGCTRRAGHRLAGDHHRDVPPGASEVRQGDADRIGGERARVVSAELPRVRCGWSAGALMAARA